ncbi:hypothetical protein C1752_02696 [Acaryochloris thomasi RCC1774]|uniref:Uncharacterized protein n=1 Tax=Acaryochloris thomasi RCC1774 TaxID=1764569 RepID=A0A2W1JW66_9CYAN|nr:hypothetical protein [Acaryochloris thomasi]PZD72971.1 hypothetical protein C1752_02696 [Acaryochloris thomasi RCC1774]
MSLQILKQIKTHTLGHSEKGFSLPSLLLGSAVTLMMVATGGYGVARMIDVSTTANAKSERRVELDRALAFFEDETRASQSIIQDVSAISNVPAEFTPETTIGVANVQRVLMLQMAEATEPVIYYLADPADDTWKGPKVIYRWGPDLNDAGAYTNAANPGSWSHQPLIDKIEVNGTTPTCPTGWNGNGAAGFYVCVDPTGKIAQVQQTGRINKVLEQTDTYATNSQMAVRAKQITPVAYTPQSGATFTENNGTIKTGVNSTMRIEIVGGAITCGAGGANIPTRADLNFTVGNTTSTQTVSSAAAVHNWDNAPAGTTLDITGISEGDISSGTCNGSYTEANSASSSPQVIALQNGDTVPNYVPFDNQTSLDSYLDSITDANGKVSLAGNEVVFIYELGETDTSSSAFDMQDLVVRATITPTVN